MPDIVLETDRLVLRTMGEGDKTQAEVDFGGELGVKRFVLRFAPLEKL